MRHALNRGRPGANDSDAFVQKLVQAAGGIAAGVVVVPATGVEGMPLELLDPGDRRELGPVQGPTRHDHEARLEDITSVSADRPAAGFIVPACLFDLRLEAGPPVKVEVLPDPLGVLENLGREGVLLLRDISGLFEQRQVNVGFNVALGARIAVPVPGPAKIAALFDDANVSDPGLLKPGCRKEAAKAPAYDNRLEFFLQRRAREARLDIGVEIVVLVGTCNFLVLVVPVRTQTLRALRGVLLAQCGWFEAQLFGSRNSVRFWFRCGFTHRVSTPFLIRTSGRYFVTAVQAKGRRPLRATHGPVNSADRILRRGRGATVSRE